MQLTIIGTGYVGLVSGVCFAQMGNTVTCVDKDSTKISNLNRGIVPIYEPGLEQMVKDNLNTKHLYFTTCTQESIKKADIIFIAVGTPPCEDGSADLNSVLEVANSIGKHIENTTVVVNKSTVPVGTAMRVKKVIQQQLNKRNSVLIFDVVSNPEFLKEGAAINDFMQPDRVVIGANSKDSLAIMKELYEPFMKNHDRLIAMDVHSAEMTKYAANAMLATKISFINEIANICELVGADVNQVRKGIGSDKRIGYNFIYPGCGYGGSCFPKDVKALAKTARDFDYDPILLSSVNRVNNHQKTVISNKIIKYFGEDLSGNTFAIWGLAFKPGTDDMREAPAITVIKELVERGAKIQAYDPKAILEAKNHYLKDVSNVKYFNDKYQVLKQADALILLTEWLEFRTPDFDKIKSILKTNCFFDGRNQFDKSRMHLLGFNYIQIGVTSEP